MINKKTHASGVKNLVIIVETFILQKKELRIYGNLCESMEKPSYLLKSTSYP